MSAVEVHNLRKEFRRRRGRGRRRVPFPALKDVSFTMERGEWSIISNHTLLHTRTTFDDHDEPERKRRLFRLWFNLPNSRPLAPEIADRLNTAGMPDPDLLIRTAGELRISNFLLWQISYAELWVTERCWPEFEIADFHQAIRDFAARNRRFGGLTEGAGG